MARPPKGKKLTLRPIRLDNDVWAECQRLGKEHGTINEGLRIKLWPPENLYKQDSNGKWVMTPDAADVIEKAFSYPAPRPFKPPLLKPKDRK